MREVERIDFIVIEMNTGKGGVSMVKETIQAVKEAEAKASELVAQALEEARRIRADAEAEADRMIADAQKRGKEAAAKQEEERTKRGEEYLNKAFAEDETECGILNEKADRQKKEIIEKLISDLT